MVPSLHFSLLAFVGLNVCLLRERERSLEWILGKEHLSAFSTKLESSGWNERDPQLRWTRALYLAWGQSLRYSAFICLSCPAHPRATAQPLAAAAHGTNAAGGWGRGSTTPLQVEFKAAAAWVTCRSLSLWITALQSVPWPTRIYCGNAGSFGMSSSIDKMLPCRIKPKWSFLWMLKEHLIKFSVLFWSKFFLKI